MTTSNTSRLPNFYKLNQKKRLEQLSGNFSDKNIDFNHFKNTGNVDFDLVDAMKIAISTSSVFWFLALRLFVVLGVWGFTPADVLIL